jgi:iron-sulfur cluster insertion protein
LTAPLRMLTYNAEMPERAGEFWSITDMAESASDIEERRIVVTENAARRIAMLKVQENAEDAFLRIAVSGGGCSGFQYGLSFDDQRNDDDVVFERDGVGIVVDDVSLGLLNGAEVDFVEDLMGASFQIRNPNAASSCGCGNSFSIG